MNYGKNANNKIRKRLEIEYSKNQIRWIEYRNKYQLRNKIILINDGNRLVPEDTLRDQMEMIKMKELLINNIR